MVPRDGTLEGTHSKSGNALGVAQRSITCPSNVRLLHQSLLASACYYVAFCALFVRNGVGVSLDMRQSEDEVEKSHQKVTERMPKTVLSILHEHARLDSNHGWFLCLGIFRILPPASHQWRPWGQNTLL